MGPGVGEEEEWKGEGLVGGRGEGRGGNIAGASTARRESATAETEAVAVVAAKKVGEEEWGGGRGGGGEREGVDQWVGGGEIEAVAVVAQRSWATGDGKGRGLVGGGEEKGWVKRLCCQPHRAARPPTAPNRYSDG